MADDQRPSRGRTGKVHSFFTELYLDVDPDEDLPEGRSRRRKAVAQRVRPEARGQAG
jgi:hypothetical protein